MQWGVKKASLVGKQWLKTRNNVDRTITELKDNVHYDAIKIWEPVLAGPWTYDTDDNTIVKADDDRLGYGTHVHYIYSFKIRLLICG